MMVERTRLVDEISTCPSLKLLLLILLKLELVVSTRNRNISNNHSCYTCLEPLIGYSKFDNSNLSQSINLVLLADHSDSCKYLNASSLSASSYIKDCHNNDNITEYECRKLVVSYRSVETYLRRDCVPKGLCSWKDKTQSMVNTPVSDCVYTDERTQKLECIYCCDTPLCNRTISFRLTRRSMMLFIIFINYRNLI